MVKLPATSTVSDPSRLTPHYLRSGFNFPAPLEDRIRATSGGKLSDEQLHALVLLDHHLNAGRLNHALRLVMDSYPILGCRYNQQKNTWERRADLDQQNLWTVHVQTRRFTLDARPGVFRFVDSPRYPSENGVLEARIFRNGTDLLVLKAHHAITDAGGLKAILYQIAYTYNELNRDPSFKPQVRVSERDVYQALNSTSAQQIPGPANTKHPKWNFPIANPALPHSPAISLQKVPVTIWHRLKEYARLNSVSIDEMLVTAYYLALHETLATSSSQKLPLILQKDLRPMLPDQFQYSVANLSADIPFLIKLNSKETAPGLLPIIRTEYQRAIQAGGFLQLYRYDLPENESLFEQKTQFTIEPGSPAIIPSLANFGDIDRARLQFDQVGVLDAYLIGPIQYTPRLHLTSSIFHESMTISARYCTSVVDSGLVGNLLHSLIAHLSDY